MKKIIAMAAISLAIASCSTQKAGTSINGEWNIVKVENKTIQAEDKDSQPFLGFELNDKSVYGYVGCNQLTGALNINEQQKTIDFSQSGLTQMMCPDMSTEEAILKAMGNTTAYRQEGEKLLLLDKNGNITMELKKK